MNEHSGWQTYQWRGEVRAMAAGTNPGAVGDPSDGACRLCR